VFAPARGAGGPHKSVPMLNETHVISPCPPSACRPLGGTSTVVRIPPYACSQYGSNLTLTGDIFLLVAKIISSALPPHLSQDYAILSDNELPPSPVSLVTGTPEGSKTSEQSSLTPCKSLRLSAMDQEEVGWVRPLSPASEQEYMRESERRSKS
jgi:hypothetical protein